MKNTEFLSQENKTPYETVNMEIIHFESEDVITTSTSKDDLEPDFD